MSRTEVSRLLHDTDATTYDVDANGRPVDAWGEVIAPDGNDSARGARWTLKAVYDTKNGRKSRMTHNLTHEEALDRKDDLLAHAPSCVACYVEVQK